MGPDQHTSRIISCGVLLAALMGNAVPLARAGEGAISFNRDIRPILSESCFRCHGPDAGSRKAGLRLDSREGATATLESGSAAVVVGDPEESELYLRVTAEDEAGRMPPSSAGKPLTPAQADLLGSWIKQGAPWEEHWSLIPPARPAVPAVKGEDWARGAIDRFLLARMEARGVAPSPEADRTALIRRLSYDLTGLPPSIEEVDAFVADPRPDAYERLVDRLLASPHYGERMAQGWLDLVRYADTVGYHSDVERSVSLYRDYVIDAFNANKPFDRFTIEQLAGDLLTDPTPWQRVASAYNMLGMSTEEGGAQAKEYLAKYAADRVRNAGSVWMGATLGCAECHDHKYDPYSARDFYAFSAFFADIRQPGVGTPKPSLAMPTPEQSGEFARLSALIDGLKKEAAADPAGETAAKDRLATAEAEKGRLDRAIRSTVITIAGEPRPTRVLGRGDWMDESGEFVEPAVPRSMAPIGLPPGQRATRLDLARWLVSPEQPQAARVVVNRLWKTYFGAGLSDSLEDLGSQGDWPSHPELLDWLAVEFRDGGWDIKRMIRLMVTSSAYRQSSRPRDDLASIDPTNRLCARQASFRRDAELIRDNALAVAGLLALDIGGESIRPYQPAGYWRFLNFPPRDYVPSKGADQYRRGLYTHWQRSLLHPSLLAFDAPSREMCTARRPISNTPQAALTLLNDPSYVEAARVLGGRALKEGGPDDEHRLAWIWRCVLSRPPAPEELAVLSALLAKHKAEYAADPESARKLLGVGQAPADAGRDPAMLAAWASAARAILNLDEAITRE
jgi:hypothetical protein